ncbi:MAG TPA: YceI family protein [Pyrinomonadaceae bacterium]|nr:YceI family protein [Pyrinomonadaceae bacterium]
MTKFLGAGLLLTALFLAACEDPAANKVKAITGNASTPATTVQAASTPQAKGEVLALTPDNSKVLFTGSKVTGRHEGGFNQFNGTIDLVNNKPEESRVWVEIDAASVFTDTDGVTKHLQTGDFFDVGKFPKASFISTKIVQDTAGDPDTYTVTGDLELRGQKKAVTFPATIKVTPESVAVNAEFSINRKDFGIVYAGKADDLIRDDVAIKLDLNSTRKKK